MKSLGNKLALFNSYLLLPPQLLQAAFAVISCSDHGLGQAVRLARWLQEQPSSIWKARDTVGLAFNHKRTLLTSASASNLEQGEVAFVSASSSWKGHSSGGESGETERQKYFVLLGVTCYLACLLACLLLDDHLVVAD